MAEFGLPEGTIRTIRRILADFPAVDKAVLYGSRAMGTYKPGSDIDLTLCGSGLDLQILGRITARLAESSIPYMVDLSLFDQLDNPGLCEHITRVGKVFYGKNNA